MFGTYSETSMSVVQYLSQTSNDYGTYLYCWNPCDPSLSYYLFVSCILYFSCEDECCHRFSYGSGMKIGQNTMATLCADSENITFYTPGDQAFWAQIHIDPALQTNTRPTVLFCFKDVQYC